MDGWMEVGKTADHWICFSCLWLAATLNLWVCSLANCLLYKRAIKQNKHTNRIPQVPSFHISVLNTSCITNKEKSLHINMLQMGIVTAIYRIDFVLFSVVGIWRLLCTIFSTVFPCLSWRLRFCYGWNPLSRFLDVFWLQNSSLHTSTFSHFLLKLHSHRLFNPINFLTAKLQKQLNFDQSGAQICQWYMGGVCFKTQKFGYAVVNGRRREFSPCLSGAGPVWTPQAEYAFMKHILERTTRCERSINVQTCIEKYDWYWNLRSACYQRFMKLWTHSVQETWHRDWLTNSTAI